MKSRIQKLLGRKSRLSGTFVWLLPILLLFVAVSLQSCRLDDDKNNNMEDQNLVGIWQPYRLNQKATLTTGAYDQTTEFTICQQKGRITFSDNNTGSSKTYADVNDACFLQDEANFTYIYDTNSNILTITNEDGTSQSGSVVKLTPSELVYELVGNYDFQGETNVQVKTTFYARRTKD